MKIYFLSTYYFQEGKEISNTKIKNDSKKKVFLSQILKYNGGENFQQKVSKYFLDKKKDTGKDAFNGAKFNLTSHLQLHFENESLACAVKQYPY